MNTLSRRWSPGLAGLGLLLVLGCGDSSYTTTDSGLQYKDLVEGSGPAAKKNDVVEVHYTGWLRNGKKFDSSHDRKEPITLMIGGSPVIAGWHEGLVGMKVGGKRKLTIPSALAYGPDGAGNDIPPNAGLTFEIELLKIK